MLLIDGVKYKEWNPTSEAEFENLVKEHTKEIFGEYSIYLDIKPYLKSVAGLGSVPDGLCIIYGKNPQWYIVEAELSNHSVHEHIVPQVARFTSGIKNLTTQRKVIDLVYNEILKDELLVLQLRKAVAPIEIHKFLSDLISNQPILAIIIDREIPELEDVKNTLAHLQIKVIEFKTYIRERAGLPVHAHLFEPLYVPAISIKTEPTPLSSPENSFNIIVYKSYMEYDYIGIWAKWKHLFPSSDTEVKLETDIGVIENKFRVAYWGQGFVGGIKNWFKAHPELKPGDKIRISVVEPMKKYRLEKV